MGILDSVSSLLGSSSLSGSPAKAFFKILSSGGSTVHCSFNPDTLQIDRHNIYRNERIPGRDNQVQQFAGSKETLNMDLLFDTSMNEVASDVRTIINPLWQALYVESATADSTTGIGRPPEVSFFWGEFHFQGVITTISQTLTLFNPSGTPIRAKVKLTMEKTTSPNQQPRQNPTSGAKPGRVHIVSEGDRLDLIANKYYKKPKMWRFIADQNDIDNPRQLTRGMVLTIPPAPADM